MEQEDDSRTYYTPELRSQLQTPKNINDSTNPKYFVSVFWSSYISSNTHILVQVIFAVHLSVCQTSHKTVLLITKIVPVRCFLLAC